jgi:hypothetical protein
LAENLPPAGHARVTLPPAGWARSATADALDTVKVSALAARHHALVVAEHHAPAVGLDGALNDAARCRCAPPAMLALTWVWVA